MKNDEKCLIDNWSLEQAAILLQGADYASIVSTESFVSSLGGLSNFISALLLYDETKFVANGLEVNWFRYEWFKKNSLIYLNPYVPTDDYQKWKYHLKSSDLGAYNYLFTS